MSEVTRKHKTKAPKKLNFAVIICSSSRYHKLKTGKSFDDPSGDLIVQTLRKSEHSVISKEIVPDDSAFIEERVRKALGSEEVDAIIVSGGTGISPRDITIESVKPILAKMLPGFGELFRKLSFDEIGSAAIMTRALAGVTAEKKAVFCIPGSPQAVKLALANLILPEAGHILKHARE
jgi:molybdenum cofactor biosynthesis protein B